MALFKIHNSTVKKLFARHLDLERNLQELFETNLGEILNIIFLAHEYSTSFGGRIDTLGIDKNGSPCIIEYKKNQSDNVINQGLSYLRWILDHKSNFQILCQNKKIDIEVEWDSPRVICILEPENYQKVIIPTSRIIKKVKQEKEKTERLQKTYYIEDHLSGIDKKTANLFRSLREKILSLDENIIEEAKAKYIAYKTSTNFTDVVVNRNGLKIFLNVKSGQLKDPQNLARDLTKPKRIGHWGNGDYEVKLEKETNLEAVFALIKQSYDLSR